MAQFWEQIWCHDNNFKTNFPSMARLSTKRNSCIAKFGMSREGQVVDWNFHFKHNLSEIEVPYCIGLHYAFGPVLKDGRIWLGDLTGMFSCELTFKLVVIISLIVSSYGLK